jgi:putative transposase
VELTLPTENLDERLQFVARRLAGEPMAELCGEFGISRKTGYKIFDRYQECGIQGLTDRSRRPYRYANRLPFRVGNFILNVKHEHPSWGCSPLMYPDLAGLLNFAHPPAN